MVRKQEETTNEAQRLWDSGRPLLVMFWQPGCAPCHAMAPVFDRLAREYRGRLGFSAVNVVRKPHVAAAFGVRATPTFALVQRRRLLRRYSGLVAEETLRSSLEHYALSESVAAETNDQEGASSTFLGRLWRFFFGTDRSASGEDQLS